MPPAVTIRPASTTRARLIRHAGHLTVYRSAEGLAKDRRGWDLRRSLGIDCAVTSTRITDTKLDAIRLHEERYVFVGQAKLLRERPLRNELDAKRHTLLDTTEDLPLFRYWRDAPDGMDSMEFGEVLRVGTIAAIRLLVLQGQGVAVLPEFFVARDLRAGDLVEICPEITPLTDFLRLVFRADDPRRSLYAALATTMSSMALQ